MFDTIGARLKILTHPSVDAEKTRRAWRRALARVEAKPAGNRWRGVGTPAAATIATLLGAGWKPRGPWAWESNLGERHAIANTRPGRGKADLAD
eukprot:2711526-Pyramimonas_sp.AAC.1